MVSTVSKGLVMTSSELALTGERTVPGVPAENYWFRRHEAAYEWARGLLANRPGSRLLEVGSGEGYGAARLARDHDVIALDYDEQATDHARRRYPELSVLRANLAALPVASAGVDVVVTLQVVEHVWDHAQFVTECRRVLAPGGLLVMSTPNRLTFSPGLQTPRNPFHTHEFTAPELGSLLNACGLEVTIAAGLFAAPSLVRVEQRYRRAGRGGLVESQLAAEAADWDNTLRRDVDAVTVSDFEVRTLDSASDSLDLLFVGSRP